MHNAWMTPPSVVFPVLKDKSISTYLRAYVLAYAEAIEAADLRRQSLEWELGSIKLCVQLEEVRVRYEFACAILEWLRHELHLKFKDTVPASPVESAFAEFLKSWNPMDEFRESEDGRLHGYWRRDRYDERYDSISLFMKHGGALSGVLLDQYQDDQLLREYGELLKWERRYLKAEDDLVDSHCLTFDAYLDARAAIWSAYLQGVNRKFVEFARLNRKKKESVAHKAMMDGYALAARIIYAHRNG